MSDGTGTTAYTYYSLGVLGGDKVHTVQGPLPNSAITFGYDELGRQNSRDINGVSQTLDRDLLGRTSWINNVLGTFSYQYDGASNRVTELDGPNGRKTTFGYYDTLHDLRLQQIKNLAPDGGVLSQFDYAFDASGRISEWTRQLGPQNDQYGFQYDQLGQLTRATQTSGGNTIGQFGYSYDDAGNRISAQIGIALTRTASDETNAPISAQGGGPVRFAGQLSKPANITVGGVPAVVDSRNRFEANVNLNPGPQTVALVATDPSDNTTVTHSYQVNVAGGNPRNYTRDNNGNITSSTSPDGSGSPNTTYEWDAVDRLVGINIGTHRTEIQYDGLGRRVHLTEKDSGNIGNEKRFLWCGDELCEERDAGGSNTAKRVFVQGEQRIGSSDAGLYFYARDHLGSIRELTDASGTVRARYDYNIWGQRTKVSGNLDTDFGFAGFYLHAVSGLNFSRTRAYDSTLGKWTSVDPIGEQGGLNLYGYVGNDPVTTTDPSGLFWYNDLANWARRKAACYQKAIDFSGLAWEDAGVLDFFVELAARVLETPEGISHLGEGTGKWWEDPSLENTPGVLMDISMAASILAGGLSSPSGAVATGMDEAIAAGNASLRDASAGLKAINTNVTADEFSATLQANGYTATTKLGSNGPVTVLQNANGSTYTVYTRSSTGASGAQYIAPDGTLLKYNLGK
jgi:RHS repeat-associated protein